MQRAKKEFHSKGKGEPSVAVQDVSRSAELQKSKRRQAEHKSRRPRSAWVQAGVFQNTRPF